MTLIAQNDRFMTRKCSRHKCSPFLFRVKLIYKFSISLWQKIYFTITRWHWFTNMKMSGFKVIQNVTSKFLPRSWPNQSRPNRTRVDPTRPNQTQPDPTRPNQTQPDPTRPKRRLTIYDKNINWMTDRDFRSGCIWSLILSIWFPVLTSAAFAFLVVPSQYFVIWRRLKTPILLVRFQIR